MLGQVNVHPALDYQGIRYWIQINGIFKKSFNVYKVVGTSYNGNSLVIHFEDFRTKFPHTRHEAMMDSPFFKPFLIPGGRA